MEVEKLKTLKEFKKRVPKNEDFNCFIGVYEYIFICFMKHKHELFFFESELETNSSKFKLKFESSLELNKILNLLIDIESQKKPLFFEVLDKNIKISDIFEIPKNRDKYQTFHDLSLLELQQNMKRLYDFLYSKENDTNLNDLKKLVTLKRDNNKTIIIFDDDFIYNSDGFIMQSICKNQTNHKGKFFEDFIDSDWNQTEIKNQSLQFSTESITGQFLFEIETKELKLILKQAKTCMNKDNPIIYFSNGSFYSKDDKSYSFDYGLNDCMAEFAIKPKAIDIFLKDLKDKEICVYMNQNNMVFLVSNTRNSLTMNFCDDFLKEYYKK